MKQKKLLFLAVCLLAGCSKVNIDVTTDPKFNSVVGKSYRTKMEFLVSAFTDNKKALMIDAFGRGSDIPTREEAGNKFPKRYYTIMMYGILPAGSEFKVQQVKVLGNSSSTFTSYLAEITKSSEPKWVGKTVMVEGLCANLETPPPNFCRNSSRNCVNP
jgi:hypothetical protein